MDAITLHWKIRDILRRVSAEADRRMHPFCAKHGITPLQMNLLIILQKNGAQTISALARQSYMADANNSALCKKLEKDGFVTRERDPSDERQVLVNLTPKGENLLREFAASCDYQHRILGKNVTPQEQADLKAGFIALQNVLDRMQEEEEE